ncbi:MAG: aminopeptidase [Caldilineaceae bacterium]|nr:aminopeptidase [Caldilineaceae bacterium]
MSSDLQSQMETYADLLVQVGVNLQPGESLRLTAELAHAPFARLLCAAAYRTGARYVQVDWLDTPTTRVRYLFSQPEYLDFHPEFDVARHQEMLEDGWARISLVGPEFPDVFDEVDPAVMRTANQARMAKLKFYYDAMMGSRVKWCVAATPTRAWAHQVYGDLPPEDALERLWRTVLTTCRVGLPDPVAAWQTHAQNLTRISNFLNRQQLQAIRYFDPTPDPDGKPSSDLTIGITPRSLWLGGGATLLDGTPYMPNIPTEEIFTTPDARRADGWVRTSKPTFPFERKVENAWFRFADGELVDYTAEVGQEVLDEFFQIEGVRRLGEVSLVDVRSPINQAGVVFYEILFDENAACHIAFGEAYLDCVAESSGLDKTELIEMGVNQAHDHLDFMIGTASMSVLGIDAQGREVVLMQEGRFVPAALEDAA